MKIWSVCAVLSLLVACSDAGRTPLAGGDAPNATPTAPVNCSKPAEGCACDSSHKPLSCYLEPTADIDGSVMCHEGTRYCRDGVWSECGSVFSYPKPKPAPVQTQSIVSPDAGLETCSDCKPNCFVVRDNLNPLDAGLGDSGVNTVVGDGGGLNLGTYQPDSGPVVDAGMYDASGCILNSAPDKDCDGILDQYDPYPMMKPFATTNPTLFLDLAPGATGTGVIDLAFNLNSVDVYFLVDQTTTMDGERNKLVADLTTGNFAAGITDCADYDFDHLPNNELKTKGIIGAIRCKIRDANFGVGYFRELPFSTYADTDEIAFRNLQDVTDVIPKVTAAVNLLTPVANKDFDEDAMPVLYTLASGNGMYFGTDRTSVPTRGGCPANTWGYPCFRNDSIPIVILFTDAASHNGPSPLQRPYDSSKLGIASANTAQSVTMVSANENIDTAVDAADLTNTYVSFAGDTTSMVSDEGQASFNNSSTTCLTSGAATTPDAFYKFSLSATKTVTVSTAGSEFDNVVAIWKGQPAIVSVLPALPNTNDTSGNAYSFGDVTGKYLQVSGSTAGLNSDYLASDLGCSAFSGSKDATFTFSLSQPTKVALDTIGSSFNTSLSVFSGTYNPVSYTAIPNTNDKLAAPYAVGTLNGLVKAYSGSTDNAGVITADYSYNLLGCGVAATGDTSPDAVYSFTVGGATTRKIRVTAEDSTLDTVLAITDNAGNALPSYAAYTNNDSETINPAVLGSLDGKAFKIAGPTAAMANNYPNGTMLGCNASTTAGDSVYKFTLGSTKTVQIDTSGSAFDSVLSLFRNTIVATDTAVAGSTAYTDLASAYTIGTTLNSKRYIVTGTTAGMVANYTNVQTGSCGAAAASASPDAVYKFHLDTGTTVRIDTAGSAAAYDTLLSVHSSVTPTPVVTTGVTGNDVTAYAIGSASNRYARFESSSGTTSLAANYSINDGAGCFAHDQSADVLFSFTVPTTGTYELDTSGSAAAFDTVLGLYTGAPQAFPTSITDNTNKGDQKVAGTYTGANDVGVIDGAWKSYIGNTTTMHNDNTLLSACGATGTSKDAYYKFTVNTARTVVIDTIGSTLDTVIGLFRWSDDAAVGACNDNGANPGDLIRASLSAGVYYVVIKGKSTTGGAYKINFKDTTINPLLECDDNDAVGGVYSKITRVLAAGTYYAVIKGKTTAALGAYKLSIKHLDGWDLNTSILQCNDNHVDLTAGKSKIERYLDPGDYYVVLKGTSVTAAGAYVLTVQDVGAPLTGFVACNENASNNTASINTTLPAGTYWVVVKAKSGATTTSGAHTVSVRDASVALANVLWCDYSTGSGGTSQIEQDFAPGTYKVIVKGKLAADKGSYKLQLRDVTAIPSGTGRVGCDYNTGTGGKSSMEVSLAAGTYTGVVKAGGATGSGTYKLTVRDSADLAATEASLYCNNGTGNSSSISKSLTAGTYYVGVKGGSSSAKGLYQVHFGGGATTTDKYFVPKTYDETVTELNKHNMRVIPILSCHNDTSIYASFVNADCPNATTQYTKLAKATDSLDTNDKELVIPIKGDGTGLSNAVVNAVAELADYLEMNVSVRVVFAPDANPGFGLLVKAVDTGAGDGCDPPVANEHKNCKPGATPRFEISFTNPLATPVPLNSLANDPNGGYNFRAELIGNNQFIVDQVPIYIIPQNVTQPPPPPPQYYPSGTYTQNLSADGCSGATVLPDWNELTWNADIPNGTSIAFSVCSGAKAAALATCTPVPVCTITGGAACSATTPCPTGSFCSTTGNCNRITGGSCTTNANCRADATCIANVCVYSGQPVDVGEVLGSQNFEPNLRVQIDLNANTVSNVAPVVNDWSINYLCKSSL